MVLSVSVIFWIQEVLLWRGRQWSLGKGLFWDIVLSFRFLLFGQVCLGVFHVYWSSTWLTIEFCDRLCILNTWLVSWIEVIWQSLFSGPKDVKDILSVLKDSASEVSESNTTVKHQVHFYILVELNFVYFILYFGGSLELWFLICNFTSIKQFNKFQEVMQAMNVEYWLMYTRHPSSTRA